MKKVIQPQAHTSVNDAFTGPAGLLTVDDQRWELRLHGGNVPGGHRILNLTQTDARYMAKDSEFGGVSFNEADRGILTRIGDKQYVLRDIVGFDGVVVLADDDQEADPNTDGTGGDFNIGIDVDFLTNLMIKSRIGKLIYAGVTTGTASAFAATVPANWPDDDGSVLVVKFHTTAADGATLAVTAGAVVGTARNLLSARSSNDVQLLAVQDTIAIIMRVGTDYHLLGQITPAEQKIIAIAGLAATDVQAALAELYAKIAALTTGGGSTNLSAFRSYAITAPSNGTSLDVPLLDGEIRWLHASANIIGQNTVIISVNGTVVASQRGELHETSSIDYDCLIYRKGANLYLSDNAPKSETEYVIPFNLKPFGTVTADSVPFRCNIGGRLTYSDSGVVLS